MKKLLFILIVCSLNGFGQDFYIDVKVAPITIEFFERIETISENCTDSCRTFDRNMNPCTTAEEHYFLKKKRENESEKLSSIRIYFKPNNSFDTLLVSGCARNYGVQSSNESLEQFWVVPLLNYEHILSDEDYKKLTILITNSVEEYFRNYNKAFAFLTVNYKLKGDFKILKPSFHLFNCGEVPLYSNPMDTSSIIEAWYPNNFIENGKHYDYENFPSPSEMVFNITFSLNHRKNKDHHCIDISKKYVVSNMELIVSYNYVGLTYKSQNRENTFWANRNYLRGYFKDRPEFDLSMRLFFMSAVRDSFNWLEMK